MPGHYTDTTSIVTNGEVQSAVHKTALDNLDDAAKALATAASGGAATGFRNLLLNPSFEVWENGLTTAPDSWVKYSGVLAAESTIIKHGVYSAALTRSGTDAQLYQDVYAQLGAAYLSSRLLTFGAWVYATEANRARLYIFRDGATTYSAYHSGSSAWEFLTVTDTTPSATSALKTGLQVDTGNTTAYLDAAILVEGGVLYGFSDSAPAFNQLPRRTELWHHEANVETGNAIAITISTGQIDNHYAIQNPSAQNDAFTHSVFLQAGNYTFSVLGQTGANRAKCDWYLDEVLVVSAQDWYNGSTVANVIKTASVTVKGDGYHRLKGVAATRNPSNTTGWFNVFTKYWFAPSVD